jgi:hypothetical protein
MPDDFIAIMQSGAARNLSLFAKLDQSLTGLTADTCHTSQARHANAQRQDAAQY